MAGVRANRYRIYRKDVREHTKANRPERRYGHTVDHIVPVSFGFTHDIPPELIGSAENLTMLPFRANIAKGSRITEESAALLREWGFGHLVRT